MNSHKHTLLIRVGGLLRTRVIISMAGILVTYLKPEIGQSVCILVGLALGVSAVDAFKGNNYESTISRPTNEQESCDNERP